MVSRFSCKIASFFILFVLGACKKLDVPSGYSSNADISSFQRLIIRIPENYIFEIRQGKDAFATETELFSVHYFYKEAEIYVSPKDFKEIIQLVMDLGKYVEIHHLQQMTKRGFFVSCIKFRQKMR